MQSSDSGPAFASASCSPEPGLVTMAPRKAKQPTAVQGVEADLKALPSHLARSGLAAVALSLARDLDSMETSATARAACARSLVQVQRELRALAPAVEEVDALDELKARREARVR
jgi:hypothetical protein